MSTTRTTMLLSAIVTLCFLGSYGCQPTAPPATNSSGAAVSDVTSRSVEITFDGLMVFHPVANHYEVGILDAERTPAPHHVFSITVTPDIGYDVKADELKLMGNAWVLEVENREENREEDSGVKVFGDKINNRSDNNSDTKIKQSFDWITDLDDLEFHNKMLDLRPGKLKPIIQLGNGELFTMYKSDYPLKRKRKILPAMAFKDFGYIADKIGLRLELRGAERLVLRVMGAGEKGVAFRLPSHASHTSYKVAIKNILPEEMAKSHVEEAREPGHFLYYYELFDNVSQVEKFVFKENKDPLQQSTNSRQASGDYSKTGDHGALCCPYICGQVLLRHRADPLW